MLDCEKGYSRQKIAETVDILRKMRSAALALCMNPLGSRLDGLRDIFGEAETLAMIAASAITEENSDYFKSRWDGCLEILSTRYINAPYTIHGSPSESYTSVIEAADGFLKADWRVALGWIMDTNQINRKELGSLIDGKSAIVAPFSVDYLMAAIFHCYVRKNVNRHGFPLIPAMYFPDLGEHGVVIFPPHREIIERTRGVERFLPFTDNPGRGTTLDALWLGIKKHWPTLGV